MKNIILIPTTIMTILNNRTNTIINIMKKRLKFITITKWLLITMMFT